MHGIMGMIFKVIIGAIAWWWSDIYASEHVVYSMVRTPLFFIVLILFLINAFGKEFSFFKRG